MFIYSHNIPGILFSLPNLFLAQVYCNYFILEVGYVAQFVGRPPQFPLFFHQNFYARLRLTNNVDRKLKA